LHLQASDVDLGRGLLTVPAAYAKNGRSRLACEATGPLRRPSPAGLAMAGVDPQTIKELGGWRSPRWCGCCPTDRGGDPQRHSEN
jgi:hypothetical protein